MIIRLRTLLLLCFTCFSLAALAQKSDGKIVGQVLHATDQSPLHGAVVTLVHTTQKVGTTTDWNGKFELDYLKDGTYDLKIQRTGFKTVTIKKVVVSEQVILINLEEKCVQLISDVTR